MWRLNLTVRIAGKAPRITRLLVLCISLCGISSSALGATAILDKLQFVGLEHFKAERVARAAGLELGQPITLEQLRSAAEHLGHSGFFNSLRFSYATSGGRMAVTFEVAEAGPLRTCVFDNFVGIPEADLQAAVRKKLPIYSGELPLSGTAPDEAASALEELLAERGITADVSHSDLLDLRTQRHLLLFEISSEVFKVAALEFPGAEHVAAGLLAETAKQLIGQRYSATAAARFFTLTLLPVYRERGYLQASFGAATATPSAGDPTGVVLSVPITEGIQYHWAGVSWEGNTVYSAPELDGFLEMEKGDIADSLRLDQGLQRIRDAYGRKGRLDLQVRSQANFVKDDDNVTFSITLTEGPEYRMGTLFLEGMSRENQQRIREAWGLGPGQVYDSSYLDSFLDRLPGLNLNISHAAEVSAATRPDPVKRIVDVTIEMK